MANVLTIELCAEDRARLDKIIEALSTARNCEHCVETAIGAIEHAKKAPNTPETAFQATEATTTAPEPETPEKARMSEPAATIITKDEHLRPLVVLLTNAGKKPEVKAIVTRYAQNVTDIPEDKVAECYHALKELEG